MWATIELSFKQIDFIGLIILQSDAVANVIGFQLDAVATIFFTV